MALRLGKNIVRGEIDNKARNRVTGRLWLFGQSEPIDLSLKGNCLRDIAGTRITFRNPRPEPSELTALLARTQAGTVGDMTASRKVHVLDVPVEEAEALSDAGHDVPEHVANGLYLEWFSATNGRVVLEGTDFLVSIAEPLWRMTIDEENEQIAANMAAMEEWIIKPGANVDDEDEDDYAALLEDEESGLLPSRADYAPMDEFEWERSLKESDAISARYASLLEQYADAPDRDELVAREMGWNWLEEAVGAAEETAGARSTTGTEPEADDMPDEGDELPEPNPETEGRDWVRTDNGNIAHPLSLYAFSVAQGMWNYCEQAGLLGDDGSPALLDMLFQSQCFSGKLAGALDGLGYDTHIEPGFVVACLKRTLKYFNLAVGHIDAVADAKILPPERLETFGRNLFDVREQVLDLMKFYRDQIWG